MIQIENSHEISSSVHEAAFMFPSLIISLRPSNGFARLFTFLYIFNAEGQSGVWEGPAGQRCELLVVFAQ